MTVLLIITFVAGLYMAWNIGANDVANAFGTSVGSGALTIKRAMILAAIFEFCGAFFVGAPVAQTISGKIVNPDAFLAAADPTMLGMGMLSALIAASIWLNVATFLGQPVSTTHAIIGAVVGFGVVAVGPSVIVWKGMGTIVLSWVLSPVFGGVLAYVVYRWGVRRFILRSRHPVYMTMAAAPIAMGALLGIISFSVVYKGLPGLKLNWKLWQALLLALGMAIIVATIIRFSLRKRMIRHGVLHAERYTAVERWFGFMQVPTACYMAFAHGANDVANAIGPLAAAVKVFSTGEFGEKVVVPAWLLAVGGVGIVLGLATYGYKVIEAIGKKITEMTPTRGFSAEFGTATSVLVFSKLGMPISTTFVIVGAVMGVGFARGFGAIDLRVIRKIFASWLVTIPISAVLAAVIFYLMRSMGLGG